MFFSMMALSAARPTLIGHRGRPFMHPENTKASFEGALSTDGLVVDGIETDIWCSGDDEPVCFAIHDNTLARTFVKLNPKAKFQELKEIEPFLTEKPKNMKALIDFALTKKVYELPWEFLKNVDVGGNGDYLIKFADFLKICKEYNKTCTVELKAEPSVADAANDDEIGIVNNYVQLILRDIEDAKSKNFIPNDLIFISFNFKVVNDVHNGLKEKEIIEDPRSFYLFDYMYAENDGFLTTPVVPKEGSYTKDQVMKVAKMVKDAGISGFESDPLVWEEVKDLRTYCNENNLEKGVYVITDNRHPNFIPLAVAGDQTIEDHEKMLASDFQLFTSNLPMFTEKVWNPNEVDGVSKSLSAAIGVVLTMILF